MIVIFFAQILIGTSHDDAMLLTVPFDGAGMGMGA